MPMCQIQQCLSSEWCKVRTSNSSQPEVPCYYSWLLLCEAPSGRCARFYNQKRTPNIGWVQHGNRTGGLSKCKHMKERKALMSQVKRALDHQLRSGPCTYILQKLRLL
ncbi:hypothetical protein BsWGS_04539 [Bradybaena similaris]